MKNENENQAESKSPSEFTKTLIDCCVELGFEQDEIADLAAQAEVLGFKPEKRIDPARAGA